MALYKFTNGTVANATEVNANFSAAISFPILNKIRQQQDRSVTVSLNKDDIFSDAYIDVNGRENTVNTGNTTALYNTNLEIYAVDNATAGGSTENYTNNPSHDTANQFLDIYGDSNSSWIYLKRVKLHSNGSGTFVVRVYVEYTTNVYTEIMAKSGTVDVANTKSYADMTPADYNGIFIPPNINFKIRLESNNNIFRNESGSGSTDTYSGTLFNITKSDAPGFSGNRQVDWETSDSPGLTFDTLSVSTSTTSVVEHTIPSGTFGSTVSSLIGKSLIYGADSGSGIKHRLENATENSGDIDDKTLEEFTAFTSEPTKYIVKLVSASSSPSPGYPQIKGSGVYSE